MHTSKFKNRFNYKNKIRRLACIKDSWRAIIKTKLEVGTQHLEMLHLNNYTVIAIAKNEL